MSLNMTDLSPPSPIRPSPIYKHALHFAPSSTCRLISPFIPSSSSDEEESSSDDEDGVFLGRYDPLEKQLVSKLSKVSPSSIFSATQDEGRSIIIPRRKKRDSREFVRRKTLLLSSTQGLKEDPKVSPNGKDKAWEGGFFKRRDDAESDIDSSPESASSPARSCQINPRLDVTPSKPSANLSASNLTLGFSAFRLTDTSPTSMSITEGTVKKIVLCELKDDEDGEATDGEADQSSAEDSDKENTAQPLSPGIESEDNDVEPEKDLGVVLGFRAIETSGITSDSTDDDGKLCQA